MESNGESASLSWPDISDPAYIARLATELGKVANANRDRYTKAEVKLAALEAENAALREGLATSQRQYCELEIALAVTHHGNGKLREKLAAAEAAAKPLPMHEQNAHFAIREVIERGQSGVLRPPSDDHWLMPFWKMGQQLAAAEARTVLTDEQIRTMARVYSYRAWGIEQVVEYTRAILAASAAPAAQEDAKRLDFMIQRQAWIGWTKDGESCRVFHLDDDGESAPIMGWKNPAAWHHDARPAIDAAIAANTPKGTLG